MTTTTTVIDDVRAEANKGQLGTMGDIARKAKAGDMMSSIKAVVTGLTAAGSHDITSAAFKAAATITGITLRTGENLPPIGSLLALRVTAATTASTAGTYVFTDVSGDMISATTHTVVGVARISDDGKTITFPTADVTAFVLEYMPRAQTDMTADMNPST